MLATGQRVPRPVGGGSKKVGSAVFIAAPFTIARARQQPMSISRGTDKEDVLRVYNITQP